MGDEWTDCMHRSLINFLICSTKGSVFIKSVDVSVIMSDTQLLCNMFSKIVDMVGAYNVTHLITNNGSNFKAARDC